MSHQLHLIRKLHSILGHNEITLVGGAVRDRLMDRPLSDIDIILPLDPSDAAKTCAAALNGRSFILDEERGIHRLCLPGGGQLDFAKIQGPDVKTDLQRRDFTINALALNIKDWLRHDWKNRVIDIFNGQRDLRRKVLVPVSRSIFRDDPLRMLRAHRIAAELGFSLSKTTQCLLKRDRKLLRRVAAERQREEFLKLFTQHAYVQVLMMEKSRLWDELIPESQKLRRTASCYYGRGGVLRHTLDALRYFEYALDTLQQRFPRCHKKITSYLEEPLSGYPRYAHLKWAVLLHDIGKPHTAKRLKGRLRFFEHEHVGAKKIQNLALKFRWSQDESIRTEKMVRHHMRPGNLAAQPHISTKAIYRFFRDLGGDAVGMLLVSLGDHLANLKPKERLKGNSPHEVLTKKMLYQYYLRPGKIILQKLLNGHDVMKTLSLKPSPLIGRILSEIQEAQSEGKIKSREEALSFIKSKLPHIQDEVL